jgi:hypothetical protein
VWHLLTLFSSWSWFSCWASSLWCFAENIWDFLCYPPPPILVLPLLIFFLLGLRPFNLFRLVSRLYLFFCGLVFRDLHKPQSGGPGFSVRDFLEGFIMLCPSCLILLFFNLLSNSLSLVILSSYFPSVHLKISFQLRLFLIHFKADPIHELLNSLIACALRVYIKKLCKMYTWN